MTSKMMPKTLIIVAATYIILLTASASAAVANGNGERDADVENWLVEDDGAVNYINKLQFSQGICPFGFKYISSVDGCYAVVTQRMEWSIAGLNCRSLHKKAHLVIINDAKEQDAVVSLLKHASNMARCSSKSGTIVWTAGQRIDPSCDSPLIWRPSVYPSVEDESLMAYTNFRSGQPDYYRRKESCMNLWSNYGYTWNDLPCRDAICSVCELERIYL